MKQLITILITSCLFSSCATLINQPTTYMTVKTTQPALIISGTDSIETKKNKAILTLERSENPIVLTTISDSLKSHVTIEARNSIAYKYNIFNLGIGALIDKNTPKRYEYPWTVKINPSDTATRVYDYYKTPRKGNLFLHISLPYVNNFYLTPSKERKKYSTGFLGISGGLDYYYKSNNFINFSTSAVMDFFLPFPAPVDYGGGEYEFFNSSYLSLSNNRKINRLSFGYGVCFVKNVWTNRDFDDPTNDIKKDYNAIGLVFPSYCQIGKAFNIGLIYRPTFYRLNVEDNFKYEHLISIDFAWKIKVKK